jgi:hypothetical protein
MPRRIHSFHDRNKNVMNPHLWMEWVNKWVKCEEIERCANRVISLEISICPIVCVKSAIHYSPPNVVACAGCKEGYDWWLWPGGGE